ncbi:MAG: carboxypeptidase [Actinobacteria bacterium]|nr:carboxypeptidase [Actinomycetota bacterium]
MLLSPRRSVVTRGRTALALCAAAALALAFAPASGGSDSASAPTAADDFTPQLVTVDTPTRADKDRLTDLGLDLTEHAGHDYVEVVLHSSADEAALRAAGLTWDVRIGDLVAREVERREFDAAFAAANPATDLPSGRNSYRVLEDFGNEIDQLVSDHPDVAKRISIGESLEGRDLTGIEIGVDVNEPEDGRPVFLMFGAHHAREWPSAELPMEFAYELLQGYTDPDHPDHERIVDLLTRGRAIIVPVSNPDGFDASRTSGDLIDLRDETYDPVTSVPDSVLGPGTTAILATPGNAYKRKNCRYLDGFTHPAGTCLLVASPGGSGTGIDLNRNYGALWGGPGASPDPWAATYRGAGPFSEPETQAIRSLISTRQVTTLITHHTFSNLILRPVGVQPSTIHPDGNPVGFSPDECFPTAEGDRGAQWLGELMAAQNGYSNQFGWELYDTTGTTEDYSYNATGGFGYTFEIGPTEFHPPFEEVIAEYTGETAAAQAVTPENAGAVTTENAADCGEHEHETVGGGNREAMLIAFENAVDATTHSLITGTAPAGATLTLERTGVFPLWNGTLVGDTVATAMIVDDGGSFEWHVNPSTRPFVQSRMAPILSDPKDELTVNDVTPPTLGIRANNHTFVVTEDADILTATVRAAATLSGTVFNYAEYHLRLVDPNGAVVAEATEFGPINSLSWTGPDGAGVPAGSYTLRVTNIINPTAAYSLNASTQDVIGERTPRSFESWTLTCMTPEGLAGQAGVAVERGEQVDVGAICG